MGPVFFEGVMASRVRLFIDFWNFQINWNERAGSTRCAWDRLADVLVEAGENLYGSRAKSLSLDFLEARIYASVDPLSEKDKSLRNWLDGSLNRVPGYHVEARPRKRKRLVVDCTQCGKRWDRCECGTPFTKSVEKGIDTAIVTDLLGLAWEDAYDIAILVSSDADFVPAVNHVQRKGRRVINATWKNMGHNLAKACWASLQLDELIPSLVLDYEARDEHKAEGPETGDMDMFLEEAGRALEHFAEHGGYLGVSYFINRWTSPRIPPPGEARWQLLNRAVQAGLMEIYDVEDGKAKAIRLKTRP